MPMTRPMKPSLNICSDESNKIDKVEVGKRFTATLMAVSKDQHEGLGQKKHTDVRFEVVDMKPTKAKADYNKKVSEYGNS